MTGLIEVHREILRRLLEGEIEPGQKINEVLLATEFELSRPKMHSILSHLERDGFLTSRHQRGFSAVVLSREEIKEVYPILWTLESLAVLKSDLALIELLHQLKQLNERLLAAQADPKLALDLDSAWHETLISACGNRRLLGLLRHQRHLIQRYEIIYMSASEFVPASVEQHDKIIQSLEQRDFPQAAKFLEVNWRHGMDKLLHRFG